MPIYPLLRANFDEGRVMVSGVSKTEGKIEPGKRENWIYCGPFQDNIV